MPKFTLDQTHKVLRDKAIFTWSFQPETGISPSGTGPKPRKNFWNLFPNKMRHFMSRTMSAFYRKRIPPWAIQEWDIKVIVNTATEEGTKEKLNYIQTFVSPFV